MSDAWRTVVPAPDDAHGPLAPLLLSLTAVTGVVDAFSYLVLGHVFVANMTGNVVFLAFALAGAPGFSVGASLCALGAFAVGAAATGRATRLAGGRRAVLLATTAGGQAVLFAVAAAVVALSARPGESTARFGLVILLSVAMGGQNAAARWLAVPDLTTTVLTLTITGMAADSAVAGGRGSHLGRRATATVVMFGGALVGAVLVRHLRPTAAVVVALVLVTTVGVAAAWTGRGAPPWAVARP